MLLGHLCLHSLGQLFQRDGRVIFDRSTGLAEKILLPKKSMFCIAKDHQLAKILVDSFFNYKL